MLSIQAAVETAFGAHAPESPEPEPEPDMNADEEAEAAAAAELEAAIRKSLECSSPPARPPARHTLLLAMYRVLVKVEPVDDEALPAAGGELGGVHTSPAALETVRSLPASGTLEAPPPLSKPPSAPERLCVTNAAEYDALLAKLGYATAPPGGASSHER